MLYYSLFYISYLNLSRNRPLALFVSGTPSSLTVSAAGDIFQFPTVEANTLRKDGDTIKTIMNKFKHIKLKKKNKFIKTIVKSR